MREITVLNIDRVACDGRGMCAELLPELIDLDEWGYPIVRSAEIPPHLMEHARRAVEVWSRRRARRSSSGSSPAASGWRGRIVTAG